jgi:tagatose 6-phosphate kinase
VDKIAAVDRLVPGEIHRPDVLSVVPGGKAINVARAASCLGLAASVVPVVAGHAGAWLEEALAARGLATRPVRIPGESRTCLSVLDRSTGQLTELYEPGPELDEAGWAAVEAAVVAELASEPETAVVVVAGSLPPGVPPDAYARIVGVARAAGSRCAVDVGGPPLAMAVAAGPWLVKVNARVAAEAVAAARALRAAGATIACVTRGLDGAVIVDEAGAAWRIGAPPELGPYPVGSGDSMLAGFAAGVAAGHPAAEAARRGSVAAAANALRPGQGELDPGDLARLEPLATVDRLDG